MAPHLSPQERRGAPWRDPGHEFSGVIAAMGESVAGEDAATFETGQEVYGMNDWFADGAMAEH